MKKLLYIFFLTGLFVTGQNSNPYDACQDGNPIGGGAGYDDIITTGTHIVSTNLTATAFKSLVEARTSGDVVFINSNVTIDLTGIGSGAIFVPQGVTIASDRGNGASEGALLFTNEMTYNNNGGSARPVFITTGTNTRFTGFRFRGPYGGSGLYCTGDISCRRQKWGISSNWNSTEIDNMELYDFPYGAISLSQYSNNATYFGGNRPTAGHLIHHNYIHNNQQNSFGYGVNVQIAEAAIYGNNFQNNRHHVAGDGDAVYNSYSLTCNTIGVSTHHGIDMHAAFGSSGPCNGAGTSGTGCNPAAGNLIIIRYNDFTSNGLNQGTNNQENIRISGIPSDQAFIEFNRFAVSRFHADMTGDVGAYNRSNLTGTDQAFQQRYVTLAPVNITYNNNTYNGETPPGQTGSPATGTIEGLVITPSVNYSDIRYDVAENTVNPSVTISTINTEVGQTYTFTNAGTGNDTSLFTVSGNTVTLNLTPDFENPQDLVNANNVYAVDILVTSSSGATYTGQIVFVVTDVVEGGEVPVTSLAFNVVTDTVYVGEFINKGITFNNGGSNPTNQNVNYFSNDSEDKIVLNNAGLGVGIGTTTYSVISQENNTVIANKTVTVIARPNQGRGIKRKKIFKILN